MDERPNQIMSDLKNLGKAGPRQRLIVYAAVIALVPALAVWALSGRELVPVPEDASQSEETQEAATSSEDGAVSETDQKPAVKPAAGAAAPAPNAVWRSVVSPDGKFQMDLPAGTKITQDASGYTYVVPEKPAGALPHMAIKIATGVDRQAYKPDPAKSLMLDLGESERNTYWLYTWKFKTWDPFARVAASLKVLK